MNMSLNGRIAAQWRRSARPARRMALGLLAAVMGGAGAVAQTPQPDASPNLAQDPARSAAGPSLVRSVSVVQMSALLQSAGFSTSVVKNAQMDEKSRAIMATTPSGGALYIVLRSCDDEACGLVEYAAFLQDAGLTLAEMNTFNLEYAAFAHVGMLPAGRAVVVARTYLARGVTMANFGIQFSLFIYDLNAIASSITPGVKATVNYDAAPLFTSLSSALRALGNPAVNQLGANAPEFMTPQIAQTLRGAGVALQ